MTIVCGYRSPNGRVWIGADSRSSDNGFIFPEAESKLMNAPPWWIGYSGRGDTGQLLIDVADDLAKADTPRVFSKVLTEAFRQAGYKDGNSGSGRPDYEQSILLASASGVWGIFDYGTVIEPSFGFWAIGSGQDFALGAAHALHGTVGGEQLVRASLAAAVAFRADCGGDLWVMEAS